MTAIATLIACLASVAIGTGMVRVLSQFKDCRSARWRHLAGSMAFWILAVFPFAFSSTDNSFPSDAVLAGVAGEVLPGALPAQQWMTQASLVFLGAWALWAAASVMLFCLRFRRTLKIAAALRPVGEHNEAIAANIPGPMLIGLRHPLVVLPHDTFAHPPAVLLAIERHERAHAARHDNWRLLTERLVLAALPWCGPLRRLHEYVLAAREELCDAVALQHADEATRHAYAQALLETLRRSSASHFGTSTMGGSFLAARDRLRAILQEAPATRRLSKQQRASAFFLALACLTVCLVTPSLESGLETIAGVRGLSLRFALLPGEPGDVYRMTSLGGTPSTSRAAPLPGNYRVTFARDAHGRWVVNPVPAAQKP